MEKNNDQLKIDHIETKKVSSFIKFTSILLIIIFAFTPLYEILPQLDICVCVELLPPGSCNFAGNICCH